MLSLYYLLVLPMSVQAFGKRILSLHAVVWTNFIVNEHWNIYWDKASMLLYFITFILRMVRSIDRPSFV